MARKATGAVVEHVGGDGRTYRALRFTAYGKRRYVSLGPVSGTEAAQELRYVLADVERGTWQPQAAVEPESAPDPVPTFHTFAEQWWVRNERQLRASTQADYKWRLEKHLLPFFADYRIDRITYDLVERYIAAKLAEDEPLSARSINMTLVLMGSILEGAVERELILRNPARGRKRRVREPRPARSYLDSAQHIEALLAAAGEIDRRAREKHVRRRAMLATLAFAGLRIGELCSLRWRDVDLAGGWLTVRASKTDAGVRKVKIRAALSSELRVIRPLDADPDGYVFATEKGGESNPSNIRNRVLAPAVSAANTDLADRGLSPLPENLTPHSLRRTFASVLCAIGEPATISMQEMGHTSPNLTLRVYAQAMRRDEQEAQRLKVLVHGAPMRPEEQRQAETQVLS
jgi:integrase